MYDELNLKENEHHNFKNFPFFWINENVYSEQIINEHKIYLNQGSGSCWTIPSTCVRDIHNLKIEKKYYYIFYLRK